MPDSTHATVHERVQIFDLTATPSLHEVRDRILQNNHPALGAEDVLDLRVIINPADSDGDFASQVTEILDAVRCKTPDVVGSTCSPAMIDE